MANVPGFIEAEIILAATFADSNNVFTNDANQESIFDLMEHAMTIGAAAGNAFGFGNQSGGQEKTPSFPTSLRLNTIICLFRGEKDLRTCYQGSFWKTFDGRSHRQSQRPGGPAVGATPKEAGGLFSAYPLATRPHQDNVSHRYCNGVLCTRCGERPAGTFSQHHRLERNPEDALEHTQEAKESDYM